MSNPHMVVTAHRGYKAKYAENTLAAFRGAVEVGVGCIETDIQTSADGVLMINHDPSTGRVYNENFVIGETTCEKLRTLKHSQDDSQRMLTLVELLQWFVDEAPYGKMKLMLDIKANNDPTVLVKIIRAMLDVNSDLTFWHDKVIFGLWKLNFYKFGVSTGLLKNFEIINITISATIARTFLEYSKTVSKGYTLKAVSFLLMATHAPEFKTLRETHMKPYGIELYMWTLNDQEDFDIGYMLGCKSFITDKVVEAVAAMREFENGKQPTYKPPSLFSSKGLIGACKFGLYRAFEYALLSGWINFKPVQFALMFFLKFIAKGQK